MRRGWMVGFWLVLAGGGAQAQLAPPRQAVDPGTSMSTRLSSDSAEALTAGRAQDALRLAEQAIATDARNPWAHYDRAAALTDLSRYDDAVTEYRLAAQSFSAADAWGKSIALYGRAHAFNQAGRCTEASAAYEDYARFVENADPQSASMARRYARACINRPA